MGDHLLGVQNDCDPALDIRRRRESDAQGEAEEECGLGVRCHAPSIARLATQGRSRNLATVRIRGEDARPRPPGWACRPPKASLATASLTALRTISGSTPAARHSGRLCRPAACSANPARLPCAMATVRIALANLGYPHTPD